MGRVQYTLSVHRPITNRQSTLIILSINLNSVTIVHYHIHCLVSGLELNWTHYLADIVEAWPRLPDSIKSAILALVKASEHAE